MLPLLLLFFLLVLLPIKYAIKIPRPTWPHAELRSSRVLPKQWDKKLGLGHCWLECKLVQRLWKAICQCLLNLNTCWDAVMPLPDIYPTEIWCIYSPKDECSKMFIAFEITKNFSNPGMAEPVALVQGWLRSKWAGAEVSSEGSTERLCLRAHLWAPHKCWPEGRSSSLAVGWGLS